MTVTKKQLFNKQIKERIIENMLQCFANLFTTREACASVGISYEQWRNLIRMNDLYEKVEDAKALGITSLKNVVMDDIIKNKNSKLAFEVLCRLSPEFKKKDTNITINADLNDLYRLAQVNGSSYETIDTPLLTEYNEG